MGKRWFVTGVMAGTVVLAWLAVPVAGQAPAAAAKPKASPKNYAPPRTAWGDPDLQGYVEWSVTADDKTTWTRPWTFAMFLTKDGSQQVFEYACHEGNYGLSNILSAARADERKAEEAARAKR